MRGNMQNKFIAVVGATASGKSALAVELAKRLNGEIISCDSMQIYRGMDIGTAKPTEEEKCGIVHHMIDIADPDESFSAGEYAKLAGETVCDISKRGKTPIMCGGTFLYLDSVTAVSSLSSSSKDDALRQNLEEYARENGVDALYAKLCEIDPISAEAIHKNNVKRVIRAIEIYETSGKTKSEWDAESRQNDAPFAAHKIIIDFTDRNLLYERINKRVDLMFERGLEREVRSLFDKGLLRNSPCASQAIGYKEFIPYFNGEISLDEVANSVKQSSRNYAKRQLTWLKRYKNATLIHADCNGRVRETSSLADEALSKLDF